MDAGNGDDLDPARPALVSKGRQMLAILPLGQDQDIGVNPVESLEDGVVGIARRTVDVIYPLEGTDHFDPFGLGNDRRQVRIEPGTQAVLGVEPGVTHDRHGQVITEALGQFDRPHMGGVEEVESPPEHDFLHTMASQRIA